jgi:hypothetical protein
MGRKFRPIRTSPYRQQSQLAGTVDPSGKEMTQVRSNERCRISSVTVARPQQTLGRLLNSSRDFAAAVDFLKRARAYDRSGLEYNALLLGALVSYSRPFKDRGGPVLGRPLDRLPAFLDAAVDLGVDLELHTRIVRLSVRAIGGSQPVAAPVQRAANPGNVEIQRFSFPNPLRYLLSQQLELEAFSHISHLMRLACVFTLMQIAQPDTRDD